ncbi:hypothetical protein GGI12_002628 [Dipsacomyces acuminosporus]|nr:hypothetical protein GGI12_002628 [Dipsacomyces acuminosporus]
MNSSPTSTIKGPQKDKQPKAANTQLSSAVPGLPSLNLDKTLNSQQEQLEVYQQLQETLAASEQESTAAFPELSKKLLAHINTLTQLKADLQDVFTRIRGLKMHFQAQYPDIFDYVQTLHADAHHTEDEEDESFQMVR